MLKFIFLLMNLLSTVVCTKIDIITDVHMYPGIIPHEINLIRDNVNDSDFVIYLGDLFNSVDCSNTNIKCNLTDQLNYFVRQINKPFLFTLGNHDGTGKIRNRLITNLKNNNLHIGICNDKGKACRHPNYNIFTLDSNTYGCDNKYSYGCPLKNDVLWINRNLDKYNHSFIILFTHIPPPNVLGLKAKGVNDERPSCWTVKNNFTLPNKQPKYHVFGHDHNNLYITHPLKGTQYVNSLKTGDHRNYGPDFGESGITRLIIMNFTPFVNYSKSLNGIIYNVYNKSLVIDYSYCAGSKSLIWILSTSIIIILVLSITFAIFSIWVKACKKSNVFYRK